MSRQEFGGLGSAKVRLGKSLGGLDRSKGSLQDFIAPRVLGMIQTAPRPDFIAARVLGMRQTASRPDFIAARVLGMRQTAPRPDFIASRVLGMRQTASRPDFIDPASATSRNVPNCLSARFYRPASATSRNAPSSPSARFRHSPLAALYPVGEQYQRNQRTAYF